MADTQSVNPFEAPIQPTTGTAPFIGETIRYEATPTETDLNRALRSTSSIAFDILALSFFVLLFLVSIAGQIWIWLNSKPPNFNLVIPLLLLPVPCLVILWSLYRKLFAAKNHLRSDPTALSHETGELTNDGMRLQNQHRTCWLPHSGLVSYQNKNNQLILSYNPQGNGKRILPGRGFSDLGLTTRLLEFHANNNMTPTDTPEPDESNPFLEPLTGPCMIGEQPADAMTFGGAMKASDIKNSPLEENRKRGVTRLIIGMFLLNAALLSTIVFGLNWQSIIILGSTVLLVDVIVAWSLFQSQAVVKDPELPLFWIQGWLNEEEVAILINAGQSRSKWQSFQEIGINESCIWLQVHGGRNEFVILPRHFFADDAQWQEAARIARLHILPK